MIHDTPFPLSHHFSHVQTTSINTSTQLIRLKDHKNLKFELLRLFVKKNFQNPFLQP